MSSDSKSASNVSNTTVTFPDGAKVPVLGFGSWRADKGLVGQSIKLAIENGYRHIDCASVYGNQAEIGEAFAAVFKSNVVKREDLYIVSKLWNNEHHKDAVEAACRRTLKELQLDYLDLFLIHWPTPFEWADNGHPFPKDDKGNYVTRDVPIKETYLAMEELVRKGLVKSIGISNFTIEEVEDVLSYATIKPVCNQIEVHPYLNQEELRKHHASKNIAVVAYSPLGNVSADVPSPLQDPVVAQIAANHKKSPAQVLLRWCIDSDLVALSKSTTPSRIVENSQLFDFKLTKDEVQQLSDLTKTKYSRMINPPFRPNGQLTFKK